MRRDRLSSGLWVFLFPLRVGLWHHWGGGGMRVRVPRRRVGTGHAVYVG